jgi:hypothetical protein
VTRHDRSGADRDPAWLRGIRVYLGSIALGNFVWEVLQLPLYTIWDTDTLRAQAFAVAHCVLGDVLIALSALVLALLLAGDAFWPGRRFRRVAILTLVLGIAYTIFSEWLNVVVRASWAYSERMPVIPVFGFRLGLAPLLQWVVVPLAAFAAVARGTRM